MSRLTHRPPLLPRASRRRAVRLAVTPARFLRLFFGFLVLVFALDTTFETTVRDETLTPAAMLMLLPGIVCVGDTLSAP